MYHQLTLTGLLFCTVLVTFSQNTPTPVRPKDINTTFNRPTFDNQIILLDPNNRAFNRSFSEINGSPFLADGFRYARVVLAGGKKVDSVKMRLDIEQHELHYLSENVPFILAPGKVAEVEFIEPIPGYSPRFKCGYPKIDNQDQHSFYNVLAEGKVDLLKLSRKKFVSNKSEMSGEIENRFDLYEDYYVVINDEMKRLKKDKDFILGVLSDKREKVETFMKENRVNLKNNDDLVKLFLYYNSQ